MRDVLSRAGAVISRCPPGRGQHLKNTCHLVERQFQRQALLEVPVNFLRVSAIALSFP